MASIARDAAGRGLRVILLEQGDLGGGASSASPRLVHGDLAGLERRGRRFCLGAVRNRGR
jgi:glycerol-3-phosphate dehydrogenase